MKQPPAFQFYASDYLSSSKVQRMSLEEQGAYVRLLCFNWQDGALPEDMRELALMCNVTIGRMERIWERIGPCFISLPDGRLVNPRLEEVRAKLAEHKAERSQAGSKGAESRWQKHGSANGSAIVEPMAKNGSPSPSPSPSLKEEEIQIQPPPKQLPQRYAHGKFENVKLSQAEHEALIEKFNSVGAEERINALSEYIASKPTKYKSHYAVILMWERKNGAKHNGNMDKGERNAETARRLLSRLHSQDSGSMPRDPARSNSGGLSRASAEALFIADSNGDSTHD